MLKSMLCGLVLSSYLLCVSSQDLDVSVQPSNDSVVAEFQPLEGVQVYLIGVESEDLPIQGIIVSTKDLPNGQRQQVTFENLFPATGYDLTFWYGDKRETVVSFYTNCEDDDFQCVISEDDGRKTQGCLPPTELCNDMAACVNGEDERRNGNGDCVASSVIGERRENVGPCVSGNSDKLECDPDGNFALLQCRGDGMNCFCADPKTGEKILEKHEKFTILFLLQCNEERMRQKQDSPSPLPPTPIVSGTEDIDK